MSARALGLAAGDARMTLCRACLARRLVANCPSRQQRRPIHKSVLEKRRMANEAWDQKAALIKEGKHPNLWHDFKERGYVKDIAGTDKQINELMRVKRIGAYVGIDATAASLHLGHLLPLMPLFWMYMNGYRAVSLIGGATSKVGDPTGRLKTREDVGRAERSMYLTKIHFQMKRIWQNVDRQAERHGYQKEWAWSRDIVNNSHWYNTTPFTEVVHRLFTRMRLGPMLTRETVRRKIDEGDGMSLAEFVYPMMQAWDWWAMFSSPRDIGMQIGGSDQYGNIVAGVEAVKLLRDTDIRPERLPNDLLHTPVAFTVPLLTDASGAKFGKTAGNAVWLDPYMTSSFDLYGYFMRRPDAELEKLLKLFTFLPLEKIAEIMEQHNQDPPKRHAHHILAFEVLSLVHSAAEAQATQTQHKQLYAKGSALPLVTPTILPEHEAHPGSDGSTTSHALRFRPHIKLPESLITGQSVARILYAAGLASSASEAHSLIRHNGAHVGGCPGGLKSGSTLMHDGDLSFTLAKNWFPQDTKNYLIDDKLLILRRGKHFLRIVEMVSDEWWEKSGQQYPGEPNKGRLRMLREQLKSLNNGENANVSLTQLQRLRQDILDLERGKVPAEANPSDPSDPSDPSNPSEPSEPSGPSEPPQITFPSRPPSRMGERKAKLINKVIEKEEWRILQKVGQQDESSSETNDTSQDQARP
ncbi:tRNA synthetase class I [Nemania sp. FL0916]|nr:tRNA synthetase class I [Nemania sp. FL0916]